MRILEKMRFLFKENSEIIEKHQGELVDAINYVLVNDTTFDMKFTERLASAKRHKSKEAKITLYIKQQDLYKELGWMTDEIFMLSEEYIMRAVEELGFTVIKVESDIMPGGIGRMPTRVYNIESTFDIEKIIK